MRVEDCFLLGRILKPHGLHGECRVYFDVDDIEDYEEMESVYVLEGTKLTPFFVENVNPQGPNLAIVAFRNIKDRTASESVAGLELYLPLDQLPELEPGQFYFHEIKGYTVVDAKLGPLGQVLRVDELPAQPVVVMLYQNHEVLIPIAGNIVGAADHETKTLHVNMPDGLVDIYLGIDSEDDEDN